MKILTLIISVILLQACVGASLITSHEGLHLYSEENTYEKPPEFPSIDYGYTTANNNDPGNSVKPGNSKIIIIQIAITSAL